MPRAKRKTAPGLAIELEDDNLYHCPGSTVAGNVNLTAASDIAIGEVSICLYGREKVYFVQHHGQGESHWRGRVPLFSRIDVLYEGKHTHKPGSWSWPFKFTFPTTPDKAQMSEKKYTWKPRQPFITTEDHDLEHSLPPTFSYRKWGFGYRFHAYIEYVLEVTHTEPEGSYHVMASKRRTVLPLKVVQPALSDRVTRPLPGIEFSLPEGVPEKPKPSQEEPSVTNHSISQTTTHTVKSFKLNPQYQDEKLTFRQKANSLFNSSDVPSFTFTATVSRPDAVRLLDQSGIPLFVSFAPIADQRLTTIDHSTFPDVRIESLTLSVRATTYIRFRSIGTNRHENTSYDVKLLDRQPVGYDVVLNQEGRGGSDSINPPSKDVSPARSEADNNSVDLSKLPGLGIYLAAAKLGSNTESPLVSTFHSYIVTRQYELRWKLELDVVGQKVRVESEGDKSLVVLEAPEEQISKYLSSGATRTGGLEDEEDESDSNEDEEEDGSRRLTAKMGKLLSAGKKKSKADEAAEERATVRDEDMQAGRSLPRYEEVVRDSTATTEVTAAEEVLPRYES